MSWPIVNLKSLLVKRRYVQKYIRKVPDEKVMEKMLNFKVYDSIKPLILKRNLAKIERFKAK